MCVDWVGLWQAFVRPGSPPNGLPRDDSDDGGRGPENHEPDRQREHSRPDENVRNACRGDGPAISKLLVQLSSGSGDVGCQRNAAGKLRQLTTESPDSMIPIEKAGCFTVLVDLLSNRDPEIREHAVTTLLNLSMIDDANKEAIVHAGAVDAITEVLKSGSMEARENSAATLFSLSALDENKAIIGESGALSPLVHLLRDGTMRGRHDAARAFFYLSRLRENGPKLVSAGILPPLVELLGTRPAGMVEISLSILSVLVTNEECTDAIGEASTVAILIDFLKSGSPGNKEIALDVLLALSENDPTQANLVRNFGTLPLLGEIANCGTPDSRRKASQLLDCLNKIEQDVQ